MHTLLANFREHCAQKVIAAGVIYVQGTTDCIRRVS
jgi:hypothetical protein